MDQKVAQVFYGYTQLDAAQQREFMRMVNEYLNASEHVKLSRKNEAYRVVLGPVGDGCACCGR